MKTKGLLLITFFIFSVSCFSQSIVYYPFNSLLGFSSNTQKRVWIDAKLQTNSYFSSLSTDIAPQINVNKNSRARIFVGGGIKLNYLNVIENKNILDGFFANAGVRASPFEKNKRIQIAFEISPFVNKNLDIGIFRSHLGFGYSFNK